MDGKLEVRRFFSVPCSKRAEDTPATRRQAPRTASPIFIIVFSYPDLM
jgi:hypothetical protein